MTHRDSTQPCLECIKESVHLLLPGQLGKQGGHPLRRLRHPPRRLVIACKKNEHVTRPAVGKGALGKWAGGVQCAH